MVIDDVKGWVKKNDLLCAELEALRARRETLVQAQGVGVLLYRLDQRLNGTFLRAMEKMHLRKPKPIDFCKSW